MGGKVIFLTHAEVVIDPAVSVPDWGLSAVGEARHAAFAESPAVAGVTAVVSSTECKAIEGAAPVAARLGLTPAQHAALGENDRSATGYLPADEFWPVVEEFFAAPDRAVRGWERAVDAQARIVAATRAAVADAPPGDLLIVSHGGVATLLRCHLKGRAIARDEGAPHSGGGCWFTVPKSLDAPPSDWTVL